MQNLSTAKVPILLVTANVGSLFEDVKNILPGWAVAIQNKIATLGHPVFVALHFQEVGGKFPQEAVDGIHQITKELLGCPSLSVYTTVLGYFDQDYKSEDKFTALGALFLIHKSLKNVAIWNYTDKRYEALKPGKQINTNYLESLDNIEKLKYPQRFFPQMKWSRKGYLKTKWRICGTIVNLVNIHLFHDPSNLISMKSSPSLYAEYRENAFEFVLNGLDQDPALIFGDFNFRLDQFKLLKELSKQCDVETKYIEEDDEMPAQLSIVEKNNLKVRLAVEPSKFTLDYPPALENNAVKLQKFDKEPQAFKKWLFEFPIEFPPSYPFKEDPGIKKPLYLEKRCPSWCDRVLLTHNTNKIILDKDVASYELIGIDTCMGDHKPVSLYLFIAGNEDMTKEPQGVVQERNIYMMLETSV